jgi:hypothetical protein
MVRRHQTKLGSRVSFDAVPAVLYLQSSFHALPTCLPRRSSHQLETASKRIISRGLLSAPSTPPPRHGSSCYGPPTRLHPGSLHSHRARLKPRRCELSVGDRVQGSRPAPRQLRTRGDGPARGQWERYGLGVCAGQGGAGSRGEPSREVSWCPHFILAPPADPTRAGSRTGCTA